MFRFSTPVPPRLSIEIPAGDVAVDTSAVDETTVELTPLDDSDTTREAIAATIVEQRGDIIAVHVPERFGRFGRSPRIGVRVAAPAESGSGRAHRIGRRHGHRSPRHDPDRQWQRSCRHRGRRRLGPGQHRQRQRPDRAGRAGCVRQDRFG